MKKAYFLILPTLFVTVVILTLIFFITPKNKLFSNNKDNVYYVNSDTEIRTITNLENFKVVNSTIEELTRLKKPSMLLIELDSFLKLYKNDTESYLERIRSLLSKGHLVLFLKEDMDPEVPVKLLGEDDIPVIPLEIENGLKIYFQAYGGVFSKESNQFIPVFYASNISKNFNLDDFTELLNDVSERHLTPALIVRE